MNEIKIKVVYEANGGEEIGLYAEGHHHPAEFCAAVEAWRLTPEGAWLDPDSAPLGAPREEIRHERWRNEPGGDGYVFRPAKVGDPGSYPVTCFAFEGGTLASPAEPPAIASRSSSALRESGAPPAARTATPDDACDRCGGTGRDYCPTCKGTGSRHVLGYPDARSPRTDDLRAKVEALAKEWEEHADRISWGDKCDMLMTHAQDLRFALRASSSPSAPSPGAAPGREKP